MIHDKEKRKITALYNFDRGYMQCLAEVPCHPKKAMSLVNALKAAQDG